MNILLAGGGTAGHVNPLLVLAKILRNRGHKVVIIGTSSGKEAELVPAAGFELKVIPRLPFPRRPSPAALKFLGKFRKCVKQVQSILREEKIDLIVGFGGYVSPPAYLAGKKTGIPVVIHEQNLRPGLANKLGARFAKALALTFASTPLQAKKGITERTGLPLRDKIVELAQSDLAVSRVTACKRWGFDPEKPVLVITGGSLGAQSINEAFVAALPQLPQDIQVLHLCGKGKAEQLQQALAIHAHPSYRVEEYLEEMEQALAVADLVVCRSGAGTVAELSALGIPAVYIPFPIGNGEQKLNASEVVQAGGARLVDNADFNSEYILKQILPLLSDKLELTQMRKAAGNYGCLHAGEALADLVISQGKTGE